MRRIKILVLSSEVWNDKINGNNVTSNWFEGMDAEFANIYGAPDAPFNSCCNKYFQLTDSMMVRSIFGGVKAGRRLDTYENDNQCLDNLAEAEPKKLYSFLKSISGDYLRFIRELIWLWGKYDIPQMKSFIDDFNPDIIFSERMASCKMLRLEKVVSKLSGAPMVAFTGDDQYSLRQFKFSPFYWMNRFMIRRRLRDMVKRYKIYYSLSQEQIEEYEKIFPCEMKILRKCGVLDGESEHNRDISSPIRIVYAGKLYLNRWKALADIVDCLKEINLCGTKMILEIYTKDKITNRQNRLLNDGINSFIKGSVSQGELTKIYKEADIALHVEAQQRQQRLLTRLSFSTKIIDCLFSGCAVLAYCWREQSGWTYLKNEDAAICVDSKKALLDSLRHIGDDPAIIAEYAQKAYECCKRNHQKKIVQKDLMNDLISICEKG